MSCQTQGRTIAIAHRGAHNAWIPENSLRAVQEALAIGADWVEFDVWNDAQGKLVVTHDLYPNGKEPPRPYLPVEPFLELVASSDMGLNFDWKALEPKGTSQGCSGASISPAARSSVPARRRCC